MAGYMCLITSIVRIECLPYLILGDEIAAGPQIKMGSDYLPFRRIDFLSHLSVQKPPMETSKFH